LLFSTEVMTQPFVFFSARVINYVIHYIIICH
jgi:hypothetical protein